MLSRILPRQFDNAYRGYRLALWLFVPIVLINMIMGLNTMCGMIRVRRRSH
jgi:hypothetical protein